jgi:hypothetical protein
MGKTLFKSTGFCGTEDGKYGHTGFPGMGQGVSEAHQLPDV